MEGRETVATVEIPNQQRFMLRNLDWSRYRAIADSLGEQHLRLAYDRGRLELMTLSLEHENWKGLLRRFVEVLTEELDMSCQSGGSTTFDREDVDRGIEPDECYYITNEPAVRGKNRIDLSVDPPPDLAFEIEVSRSAIDRLGIYAAIGVPEVWRFDGETLRVLRLSDDGAYAEVNRSAYFPQLTISALLHFLQRRGKVDETTLVRSFRHWVREQIARGWK